MTPADLMCIALTVAVAIGCVLVAVMAIGGEEE